MKNSKIIILSIASVIIYLLLCTILFFSIPFMVSWGEEKAWYLKILSFLQDHPFALLRKDGDIALGLLFINALFWTTLLIGLLYCLRRLLNKIFKN